MAIYRFSKQLQVEEAVIKEGRSKKKHDGRIRIEIPGKADSGEVGSEGVEPPPPSKKQRVEKTTQKAGGADKGKGAASSSSQPPAQDAETAAPLSWSSFDPLEFIERGVTMVGDMTRFTNTSTGDLRKKALEYEVKGTLLNYLLTNRQEQEVLEARQKVKMVDDNLADIEKRYSETKAKLENDIKKLKEEREGETERLKKEYEEKLSKVKESYAASEAKLKENSAAQDEKLSKLSKEKNEAVLSIGTLADEKARLENDINELQLCAANQYDEGFAFAIEQVKLLFPDLDAERLGEADAMKQIVDGKLVPYVPPQ
ncbi:intracellular protein transport protein USO1-like [Trifolium pratense]|uniref:intracellular protein transport protein USO1-like n=1 Tax=Trifolium pratense TaxID=57577 RepID=UPI001E6910D6|nr:intracellular protein transport protein USO1-like [Trifolium pratense]